MMIFWFVIIGVLLYMLFGGNIDFERFQKKSSNDLLDERLAKGEISVEEYQKLKTALKESIK